MDDWSYMENQLETGDLHFCLGPACISVLQEEASSVLDVIITTGDISFHSELVLIR